MSTRTVERVDGWESVPFEGGFAGLQKLAGQEFSGAVIAGPARLFMLNGTVVGVLDGDIEDFEAASGTAKRSPHEALPLLAVMQERADEVKAQYYTEETALAEVDRTLSSGSFTGFIELSENVLSGDYYTVYHQGRSMSVAWVGNTDKLLTDDEAFETANDEVGIYEVMPVDIDPIEIPAPPGDSAATGSAPANAKADSADSDTPDRVDDLGESDQPPTAGDPDSAGGDTDTAVTDPTTAADATDEPSTPEPESESEPIAERGPVGGGPPGSKAAGTNPGGRPDRERRQRDGTADSTSRADAAAQTETADTAVEQPRPERPQQSSTRDPPADSGQRTDGSDTERPTPQSPGTGPSETQSADSEPAAGAGSATADLETRSIPSLDPGKSGDEPAGEPADVSVTQASTSGRDGSVPATETEPSDPTRNSTEPAETVTQATPAPAQQPSEGADPASRNDDRVAELESQLEAKAETVSELEAELTDLEATNQTLRAEANRLETDLADARAEIERLEEQLNAQDDRATGGTRLSVSEAINGTNLFVRYHSKGKATLEEAKNGDASREDVEENLRLEYHTQFEAEDATVDGTPFQEFLETSIQYRFVSWLIRNLLYEIRDTSHVGAMRDLYEGLPNVDRAELNGQVTVIYTEDGQENRSQERFDVVVRDRMGNPIVVANINDSREPATEGQMTDLIRDAERVGNASDSFASAFLVTSSFFEPGALETATEATSTGLLNRDKRKSFVNLSRKSGFHLCLLEARNQEFHLAVPEL